MVDGPVGSDIAVIGMSCRVAGANSPSELWDILVNAQDVQREITRFNVEGFYHPDGGPRKGLTNVKHAYMMDDNTIDRFDNVFFSTTPNEAAAMDPQQRMLLEIAYEAVENAGIPLDEFVGTDTAIYAGMEGTDYHTVIARDLDFTPMYLATGTATSMAASRISYFFNLSGPSLVVDTACSSAMAALHQAVRALQNGDAGMAMVCGAKLIINPDMFIPSSEMGFLSPDGKCKSFDASGDGYGRGEGVLALLLKPLKRALCDNDSVRAVIKGSRLNQDGRTQGITLPSAEAQKNNMQSLYEELKISSNEIQYVEAHGTGTVAGDPLEISAINSVFGPRNGNNLVVGSVKSSIGHLESSSALAAIIKTVECLEKGKIPGQMHFVNPNPSIDFTNIKIPLALIDWPWSQDGVRRAGINTFGAGGTNGHAVVEAYLRAPSQAFVTGKSLLFKVSAADEISLRKLSLRYADYVEQHKPNLHDLAYTLLARRSTLKCSAFLVAQNSCQLINKLRVETYQIHQKGPTYTKKVAFLITGQGAQWAQMGKDLIDQSPIFKSTLLECEIILSKLPDGPSWSIVEELLKAKDSSNVYQAEYAQPLCTALQLALVVLLQNLGMTPVAVVGHSSGEICAAFVAGMIPLRDAIIVAYYRGLFVAKSSMESSARKPKGCMCAIGLSEGSSSALLEAFGNRVQLAAVNSPTSCTLSGDEDAIQELVTICAAKGIFCRKLRVDAAYHSHHMLPIACGYEKALANAQVLSLPPQVSCEMFSTVTGHKLPPEEFTPSYCKQNLTSTVQYALALTQCLQSHPEINAILEIGPHPALKGPTQETLGSLGKGQIEYFHTCFRDQNSLDSFLLNAGAMTAYGVPLKAANINAQQVIDSLGFTFEYGNVLTDVPHYEWDHTTSYWAESRVSHNVRYRQFARHVLLGSRYVDDIPVRPCWRNHLMLKEIPWLMKLKIDGIKDMPAVVYIFIALEAARQLLASADSDGLFLHLTDVVFYEPLTLDLFATPDTTLEIQLACRKVADANKYQFEIFSQIPEVLGSWTKHCSGNLGWIDNSGYMASPVVWNTSQGSTLLEKSLALPNRVPLNLRNLQLSSQGSTGLFEGSTEDCEHYSISPMVLESIFRLPPLSSLGQNLPAEYKLLSIDSIVIPTDTRRINSGGFAIDIEPNHPYGIEANIELRQGNLRLSFSRAKYQGNHLRIIDPARRSLFFKPMLLPDISMANSTEQLRLFDCMRLIAHKWPMSDIRLVGVSEGARNDILDSLHVAQPENRTRFQSLQILGKPAGSSHVSKHVQYIESFNPDSKVHMIFSGGQISTEQILAQLWPGGLACICAVGLAETEKFSKLFEMVNRVTDVDHEEWILWRMRKYQQPTRLGRKTVVFSSPTRDEAFVQDLPNAERVILHPSSIGDFCKRNESAKYAAVVLDSGTNSIIPTWPGQELLPWLQALMKFSDGILWVTQQDACDPFHGLAGSLLRTLQSEQPSLKVTWLVFKDIEKLSVQSRRKHLLSAYDSMLNGENETRLEVEGSQARILRYLPDDELSSAIGLVLPKFVDSPFGEQDYIISIAAPREPVILSSYPNSFLDLEEGNIPLIIEASVVDIDDVLVFGGTSKSNRLGLKLGMFFAGRLEADGHCNLSPQVVGWHPGSHRKRLGVPAKHLYEYYDSNPAVAAAEFAGLAIASCVTEGVARVREGDSFSLDADGFLGEALEYLCAQRGAKFSDGRTGSNADFVISLDPSRGLLVNGGPVDIAKYLVSDLGRDAVALAWRSHRKFKSPLHVFDLPTFEKAFASQPYSTVIAHTNVDKIQRHVPIYKESKPLLSPNGAYILIGGLGGLGRFVCSWMIDHGAKNLVVISRSGINSQGAQETYTAINASEASLQVIKSDATDRPAMTSILHKIRQQTPIKGIINMAMVLGDAPMASMTGEEWDRALRVKIDSSWILHEETLQDNLDLFVLFSSIASVLGNRNQGNYNVGNTFLNGLASYRHSNRLPAVSIALGAMTDIGVLHSLNNPALLPTLTRSGLTHLDTNNLNSILLAAVLESSRFERSLIITGLEMFERVDGKIEGRGDPLYWSELPEFSHLSTYTRSETAGGHVKEKSLRELVGAADAEGGKKETVMDAFTTFLSSLLGFNKSTFSETSKLAMYGLDSLSAVSCQYWLHRELGVNVDVGEIFGAGSIEQLVGEVVERMGR